MKTLHTLTTAWVQNADLGAEVEVEITFRHSFAIPERRYVPGAGDIIEFVSAKYLPPHEPDNDWYGRRHQEALDDWASDWLFEDGWQSAIEKVRQIAWLLEKRPEEHARLYRAVNAHRTKVDGDMPDDIGSAEPEQQAAA